MTVDEKVAQLHGLGTPDHIRYVPGVPRLGIPPLVITNGPAGVGPGDDPSQPPATALPAPISLAASWDPSLALQYGRITGAEARDLGENLVEGPDIDIARTPLNGRTFEGYGEDPYLAGQIAAANIRGIQSQGVVSQVKHFPANNQQTNQGTIDDAIDQRTLREIYLPAFEASVKQGDVGAVMCATNAVNGAYSCENRALLTGVLRQTFGFGGFIGSDFGSTYSTLPSVKAGLDLEMPFGLYYADPLKRAVLDGAVSMNTVNTMLIRRYAVMIRLGLFDEQLQQTPIPADADGLFARTAAEQGAVLLKNANDELPLDAGKLHSIAVVGPYAGAAYTGGGGSSHVKALYTVDPATGIADRVGQNVAVSYASGTPTGVLPAIPAPFFGQGLQARFFGTMDLSGNPLLTRSDPNVDFDWKGGSPAPEVPPSHWSAQWTGTLTPPVTGTYLFALASDDGSRLFIDGQPIIQIWSDRAATPVTATVTLTANRPVSVRVDYYQDTRNSALHLGWWVPGTAPPPGVAQAAQLAAACDVAIVMVGDAETEGVDRASLSLPGLQDELVAAVVAANPHTIVVLKSGGPVLMPWASEVPAILEAWYPGEEDGNAVAALLFGNVDPSGKLPITFPQADADTPIQGSAQYPGENGVVSYSEGLQIGYRWYDTRSIAPLFPFGYGLSYTTFTLSGLTLSKTNWAPGSKVSVGVTITNTGARRGAEVVQLYVGDPPDAGEPPKQLKAFRKVSLLPGKSKRVSFTLESRALAVWSRAANNWVIKTGGYQIMLGTSSRSISLRRTLSVHP